MSQPVTLLYIQGVYKILFSKQGVFKMLIHPHLFYYVLTFKKMNEYDFLKSELKLSGTNPFKAEKKGVEP